MLGEKIFFLGRDNFPRQKILFAFGLAPKADDKLQCKKITFVLLFLQNLNILSWVTFHNCEMSPSKEYSKIRCMQNSLAICLFQALCDSHNGQPNGGNAQLLSAAASGTKVKGTEGLAAMLHSRL